MSEKLLTTPPQKIEWDAFVSKELFEKFCQDNLDPKKKPRLRSWDSCYLFFQKHFDEFANGSASEDLLQHAEAELGFYLASFGMYRPSSKLFQHNHTIFRPIILDLFKTASEVGIKPFSDNNEIIPTKNVLKLIRVLDSHFNSNITKNTLYSKILMGMFGCLPAFDTNLKVAIKEFKLKNSDNKLILKLNTGLTEGPKAWIDFASDPQVQAFFNKSMRPAFLSKSKKNKPTKKEKKYPIMRVIDLYFWSQQAGKQK